MIEQEREFIYGIWFCDSKDHDKDWMGTLKKADGKWVFEYRFRYYSGTDDPHDGSDKKNFYSASCKDDSEETLQLFLKAQEKINELVEDWLEGTMDFVDLQCYNDDPKMLFELGSRPWAHVKMLTKEEFETFHKEHNQ